MFPPEFQQLTYLQTKLANKLGQYLVETVVPSWVYSRAASLTCSSICLPPTIRLFFTRCHCGLCGHTQGRGHTLGPTHPSKFEGHKWWPNKRRRLRQRDHGSLSAPSDTQTQQESSSSIDMDRTYLPIEIFGLPITKSSKNFRDRRRKVMPQIALQFTRCCLNLYN
jgi:hypothetical protein